jgi:hypothetical protein
MSANQSKKFIVHLKSQKQKLQIIVFSHASVEETIGFVCYKYTIENREPFLTYMISHSLFIIHSNCLF